MRFITHMSPWLPAPFFGQILDTWGHYLGEECELVIESRTSGPTREQVKTGSDPLSSGQVDAGILCAPTYLWARENDPPRVRLAGWVPVFQDLQEPVYHSLVLVPENSEAQCLEDLRDAKWCFNDPCSLSGYHSVLTSLDGNTGDLKAKAEFSGGHIQSIEMLLKGQAEACAVDANGWFIHRTLTAFSRLRVVEQLGPFPAQPLVFSEALPEQRLQQLEDSLQRTAHDPQLLQRLHQQYGLVRFVPSSEKLLGELDGRL